MGLADIFARKGAARDEKTPGHTPQDESGAASRLAPLEQALAQDRQSLQDLSQAQATAAPIPAPAPAPASSAGDADIARRFATARHDLRQPVQAMRMFLYLLEQKLTTDAQRDLAQKLEMGLDAMDAVLAGELLAYPAAAAADKPSTDPGAKPDALPHAPPDTRDSLIAVLEDDAVQLAALESLLEEWGYSPVTATSPEELHAALAGRRPALVLSDNRLAGGANGVAIIRDLRRRAGVPEDDKTLPGLLLTGDTNAALIAGAKAVGICVLAKPLTPSRLRESVANALNSPRP